LYVPSKPDANPKTNMVQQNRFGTLEISMGSVREQMQQGVWITVNVSTLNIQALMKRDPTALYSGAA